MPTPRRPLGIAALRDNDPAAAQGPLQKAVVLDPRNPFALRSLGQLLLMQRQLAARVMRANAKGEPARTR